MKTKSLISFILFSSMLSINAQNTTFNNVAIGTDESAYGVKIKANFPGHNGGWARFFSVANGNGDQNFISIGTVAEMTNGVTVTSSIKNYRYRRLSHT